MLFSCRVRLLFLFIVTLEMGNSLTDFSQKGMRRKNLQIKLLGSLFSECRFFHVSLGDLCDSSRGGGCMGDG